MSLIRTVFLLPVAAAMGGLAFIASNATANMPPPILSNPPQTIVIGIDLSTSNPLIRDSAFAFKVSERIKPLISGLAPHSRVLLRSFGAYNSSDNSPLTFDITIAPKTARAQDMANLIAGVVAGVPKMVRDGRLQAQNATNIVPFLLNIAQVVDCRAMPVHIILASDGVEDSQVANLSRRNSTVPAPPTAPFPGCEELQILGIGRGLNSPNDTQRLFSEWQFWSQSAGFKSFVGLNDW